jgi:hypothetical protein
VILISYGFNWKVCFLFKLQQPKLFFIISFRPKNLSFPSHSILAGCLIFTTIFNPNSLSVQLVVFHLESIQTLFDSGYQSPPHTVAPLHPLIVSPHGNQEPHHMLLSPSEIGATHSSLLPKHWIPLLTVDHFSFTVLSLLPPLPYKRRREPHNLSQHPFPVFLWVSPAKELALTGAQVTAATTPHRLTASVTPPS